ncbi:hypothetical protein ACFX5F_01105 [Flavobacterium sp. ZS1P70]|uniref:Uncharacterized protein n=1 Tax=Flavobacterium zhoui TaxID=3230414 RepID=A0ABW6I1H6_9FLAO
MVLTFSEFLHATDALAQIVMEILSGPELVSGPETSSGPERLQCIAGNGSKKIIQITKNSEGIFCFKNQQKYVRSKKRRPQRAGNVRQNHG